MAITYTRAYPNWVNDEAGGTEADADAFNTIEAGLDAVYKLPNAAGELVYGSAADTLERLAAGTATQLLHGGTTPSWSGIVSADITDGTIVNDDINASAAIAYSKLTLATSIVNADVAVAAAIELSKLASVAWTPYTPAWTSSATQPALVNGTTTGGYIKIGRLVVGFFQITLGGSSTVGTGNYRFSLPVTIAGMPGSGNFPAGIGKYVDASALVYQGYLANEGSGTVSMNVQTTSPTVYATLGAAAPVVPASGDIYQGLFVTQSST